MAIVRPLLACGVAASASWVAADLVAGTSWSGYDFIHQSVSELLAIGSPTRGLFLPFDIAHGLLLIAFASGVWASAQPGRGVRVAAGCIAASAGFGLAANLVPMRIGVPAAENTGGVVVGALSVGCSVAAMVAGAVGFRGRLRTWSAATILAFVALTPLGLVVAQNHPATGAQERTMAYAYLLWVVLLAVALWQSPEVAPKAEHETPPV